MKFVPQTSRRAIKIEARQFPSRRCAMLASTALGAALMLWQSPVHAGPDGERIVAGQVSMGPVANTRNSTITNSYSTGKITGTTNLGALVGDGTYVTVTKSFSTSMVNGATATKLVGLLGTVDVASKLLTEVEFNSSTLADLGLDGSIWQKDAGDEALLKWNPVASGFKISGNSDVNGKLHFLVNGVEKGTLDLSSGSSFSFRGKSEDFANGVVLITITESNGIRENYVTSVGAQKLIGGVTLSRNSLTINGVNKASDAGTIYTLAIGSLTEAEKSALGIMPLTVSSDALSLVSGRLQLKSLSGDILIDRKINSEFLTLSSAGKLAITNDITLSGAGNDVLVMDYATYIAAVSPARLHLMPRSVRAIVAIRAMMLRGILPRRSKQPASRSSIARRQR